MPLCTSLLHWRRCECKNWNILWGVLGHVFMFEIKRTLKLSMLFCSNMVKGGYFSVSCSSEFRPPILAYLGSNVYLVYNFLHPAPQRREISFPCISTYMSLWCCGPVCTSGKFQGNVYQLHSVSHFKLFLKLKGKLQNASTEDISSIH